MSYQLDYYKRNKEIINAKRRASYKTKSKTKSYKTKSSSSHIPRSSDSQATSKPSSLQVRLHRFQRTYTIQNAVSEEKLKALKLNDKLVNIKQYIGAGFRIIKGLGWTLELEGLEIISDYRIPAAVRQAQAISMADNIATQLGALYGLLIAKEGHTPPKITEHELNATQMTDRLKEIEKKGIVPLYTDNQGYMIWADWSYGIGGLESNKVLYIQRISDFAKDLGEDDGWEKIKDNQRQASINIKEITEKISVLITQIELEHNERLALRVQDIALRKDIKKHLAMLDAKMERIYQRKLSDYK